MTQHTIHSLYLTSPVKIQHSGSTRKQPWLPMVFWIMTWICVFVGGDLARRASPWSVIHSLIHSCKDILILFTVPWCPLTCACQATDKTCPSQALALSCKKMQSGFKCTKLMLIGNLFLWLLDLTAPVKIQPAWCQHSKAALAANCFLDYDLNVCICWRWPPSVCFTLIRDSLIDSLM